jgi:hypothetical protein
MAIPKYGRKNPTPPHVQAHDNPSPVVKRDGPPNVMPQMEEALKMQNERWLGEAPPAIVRVGTKKPAK